MSAVRLPLFTLYISHIYSDNQWYDRYGRVLSYPEDMADLGDVKYLPSRGGTYPRRIHATPDEGYDHGDFHASSGGTYPKRLHAKPDENYYTSRDSTGGMFLLSALC